MTYSPASTQSEIAKHEATDYKAADVGAGVKVPTAIPEADISQLASSNLSQEQLAKLSPEQREALKAELEQQIDSKTKERGELQVKRASAAAVLETKRDREAELIKQNEDEQRGLRGEIKGREESLVEIREERESILGGRSRRGQHKVEEEKQREEKAAERIEEIEKEEKQHLTFIEQATARIEQLSLQIKEPKGELREVRSEIARLTKEIAGYDTKISQLDREITALNNKIETIALFENELVLAQERKEKAHQQELDQDLLRKVEKSLSTGLLSDAQELVDKYRSGNTELGVPSPALLRQLAVLMSPYTIAELKLDFALSADLRKILDDRSEEIA